MRACVRVRVTHSTRCVTQISVAEQIEGHVLRLITKVLRSRCPRPLSGTVSGVADTHTHDHARARTHTRAHTVCDRLLRDVRR